MSYEVKPIDLAAVFDQRQLIEPQRRISEIVCFEVPGGASFQLKVGSSGEWITIGRAFTMEPTGEKESNGGLYIRNLEAQADVSFELVIVLGDGELGTVLT